MSTITATDAHTGTQKDTGTPPLPVLRAWKKAPSSNGFGDQTDTSMSPSQWQLFSESICNRDRRWQQITINIRGIIQPTNNRGIKA